MGRLLRILAIGLGSIIALVAIAIFVITLVIDPNDYKPQIQDAARTHGNLDLAISGELGWAFFPSLGVTIGTTEARIADQDALFARINDAHVSVQLLPLLTGTIALGTLTLDGLTLHLVDSADGANWEQIGPPASADTTTPDTAPDTPPDAPQGDAASAPTNIPLTIPELAITNGTIHYLNETDGTDIRVSDFNLLASDIAFGDDFPLHMTVRYADQSGLAADVTLDTLVMADLENEHYRLANTTLTTGLSGVTANPLTIVVTQQALDADMQKDQVSIVGLAVNAASALLKADLQVSGLSGKPQLAGTLALEPMNLNTVLAALGEAPVATANPNALSAISLNATLSGPANSVILKPFNLKLDNSTLSGHAGITDLDTSALRFDLTLDTLNVDDYLPPASAAPAEATPPASDTASTDTGAPAPLSEEPLLPLDDLRTLLVDGRFAINTLTASGIAGGNMEFLLSAKDGLLQLKKASGNALDGSFNTTASLDARSNVPQLKLNQQLTDMQLQPLVQMAAGDDLFTGVLDLSAALSASGNSEKALSDSAKGTLNLTLNDGTLNGINLHSVLLTGIEDLLSSMGTLASFLPQEKMQKLQDSTLRDTRIDRMQVNARLQEQVAYVDTLQADLEEGSLTGKGYFDVMKENFDFRLALTSPSFSDNKYFKDRAWPLKCAGNLNGDAAKWCGHDKDGFKQIGKEIAAQAARDKLSEKLGVQVEGDTVKEAATNAAKQKADQELQKKLDEELGGELGKEVGGALKKLFGR